LAELFFFKNWYKRCYEATYVTNQTYEYNMHNIRADFDNMSEEVKQMIGSEISKGENYLRCRRNHRFSCIEVIAISFIAECLGIDSGNHLFTKLNKVYLNDFDNMISMRQYNDYIISRQIFVDVKHTE